MFAIVKETILKPFLSPPTDLYGSFQITDMTIPFWILRIERVKNVIFL